jgi:hypothetical protein
MQVKRIRLANACRGCKLLIMPKKKLSADALEFFRKAGKRGGKKGGVAGGKATASKMTAEERRQRAKAGAAARWGKKPKKGE